MNERERAARQLLQTAAGLTAGIALGDLNGDGALDIATVNFQQQNKIYRNTPSAGFAPPIELANHSDETGIVTGDLNGDGALDIVSVSRFGNAAAISE